MMLSDTAKVCVGSTDCFPALDYNPGGQHFPEVYQCAAAIRRMLLRSVDARPIRVERLCAEVTRALPDDAILVADTGYSGIWTGTMIELNGTGQGYLRAAGSLGWAFPASLGAKCAAGTRPVVCFTGDGGFYYHLAELETARRRGIAVAVIVNNNSGFGQNLPGVRRALGNRPGSIDDLGRRDRGGRRRHRHRAARPRAVDAGLISATAGAEEPARAVPRDRAALPKLGQAVPRGPAVLDTNVFINALTGRGPAVLRALLEVLPRLFVAAPTRAELAWMRGRLDPGHPGTARVLATYEDLLARIDPAKVLAPTDADWLASGELAGRAARALAGGGRGIATAFDRAELISDALIAVLARGAGFTVITEDADFDVLAQLVPGLNVLFYDRGQ